MNGEPLSDDLIEGGDAFLGRVVEKRDQSIRFMTEMGPEEIPLDWCNRLGEVEDFTNRLEIGKEYYILELFSTSGKRYVVEVYLPNKSFLCSIWCEENQ